MGNRLGVKFLIILLLVAFGIFFGVDLATRGMENIHGPFIENTAANLDDPGKLEPDTKNDQEDESSEQIKETVTPPEPQTIELSPQPPGVAEMIGKGLQEAAQLIVNAIVSIFEWLL